MIFERKRFHEVTCPYLNTSNAGETIRRQLAGSTGLDGCYIIFLIIWRHHGHSLPLAKLNPRWWQNTTEGPWGMWKELDSHWAGSPLIQCVYLLLVPLWPVPSSWLLLRVTSFLLWQQDAPYRICFHRAPVSFWWQLRLVLKRNRTKRRKK